MRFRRPSPSLVISIVALVMASTGSAVAAVSYARKAGAVDGKSAVSASSSLKHAAGRLVATARGGAHKGQIPVKFLANVPASTTWARALEVTDNAAGVTQTVNSSSLGSLSVACNDQNDRAGIEDPTTTVTYSNTTGGVVNFARAVGGANPAVLAVAPGTTQTFVINGSNTFHVHLEANLSDVIYDGQVRQDGRGTPTALCYAAGTAQKFTP